MVRGFMPVTVNQAENAFCSVSGAHQGAWLHELRSVQSAGRRWSRARKATI